MAVVILSGLFSSTALNMVVLPALYLRFGRAAPYHQEATEERELERRADVRLKSA
jgi:hypothetical protein